MTDAELLELIRALAGPIRTYIARSIEPLERRIAELEGRSASDASDALAKALRAER